MVSAPEGLPRLLFGMDPTGAEPMTRAQHERVHGPLPQPGALELLEAIEHSGLRGRGGADFPTAIKLRAVAERRRPSAVVVNGNETEPASGKDRLLLTRLPHLVLDGAVLAARALGIREVVVAAPASARATMRSLDGAIALRAGRDGVEISLVGVPDGYVSGEESALTQFLNGGAALPTFVPPRPFERGFRARPTLIQNPETLAQVALVARHGEHWYRQLGTVADPGTALVTISGAVAAPGVYELAFGTSFADLLRAAGGPAEPLRALLVGGYFGTWVDATRAMELRLAREDLREVGCSLGAGVLVALGESACGLHESARVIDYLARESAGQCGPCVHGLRAIADSLQALADGLAPPQERERVLRWCGEVQGRGACHHPNGAVRFVESALGVFAEELKWHRHHRCGARAAGLPLGREPTPAVRRAA